jgi:S1-C subfamily serine protease
LLRDELVRRLEQATVLVLSPPVGTGTGFFVTPDTVVTNRHVVEGARQGPFIVGKGLPAPLPVRVVAISRAPKGKDDANGPDFAILKVRTPLAMEVLPLAESIGQLEEVVAAGFPGLLLSNDAGFRALLDGDSSAIPSLALSRGEVMTVQAGGGANQVTSIAHTAQISGGNSGGPLVDRCGRVVGINTFMRIDNKQASKAGFALASANALAFMRASGIVPTVLPGHCGD